MYKFCFLNFKKCHFFLQIFYTKPRAPDFFLLKILNINFIVFEALASANRDIFEKKSASASALLFGERERWFLGALIKLA
jgi:hypothetical protein